MFAAAFDLNTEPPTIDNLATQCGNVAVLIYFSYSNINYHLQVNVFSGSIMSLQLCQIFITSNLNKTKLLYVHTST